MTLFKQLITAVFLVSALVGNSFAQEKIIKLTSTEWPPYTGAKLKEQGASAVVAKEAFKAMGYTLVVEFYPWTRAVTMAKEDPKYMGYFPEYHSADLAKEFTFSDPMGNGPLGFAERNDKRVTWNSIDDLSKFRVGVVQDYVNTEEFDKRVTDKKLKVDVTTSDLKNLQKLDGGRIDLAVVDKNVMDYLIRTAPELASAKTSLRFNDKLLEDKKLYICFKKGAEGEKLAKIYSEGLKKINVAAIMAQSLK